jgi:hypothetical protein
VARISLNLPASLADTADKPGKYSGRASLSRRNSGFLKPAVPKKQRKTAGNSNEITAKTASENSNH